MKCDKCAHFFVVLSEQDTKKAASGKADPEVGTAKAGLGVGLNRKPPPPPKKIYEYLVRMTSQTETQKRSIIKSTVKFSNVKLRV